MSSNVLQLGQRDQSFSSMNLQEELTKMDYVEEKMLEAPVPQKPRPIEETPLTVVSTLSELNEMAAKCRIAGEIAVGPSHHTINIVLNCFDF